MEIKPSAEEVIRPLHIKRGMKILDFGCGEGKYAIPLAGIVKDEGEIYALDKEKEELEKLSKEMKKKGLKNITLIHSHGKFNLPDGSIDIILLFDVLHYIDNKNALFRRFYEILKPEGVLSIFPHTHFSMDEVIRLVAITGLFALKETHEEISVCNFKKKE